MLMFSNTVSKMDLDLQHQPMGAKPIEPLYLSSYLLGTLALTQNQIKLMEENLNPQSQYIHTCPQRVQALMTAG